MGASLAAALASVVLGLLIAWVLSRYEFPLKRLVDSLVDLPFALPTAVAGLVYSSLYVESGWLGQFLVPLGIQIRLFAGRRRAGAHVPGHSVCRSGVAAGAGEPGGRRGRGRLPAGGLAVGKRSGA